MKGFIIWVETRKMWNGRYRTTKTLVDNKVYPTLDDTFLRIRQIKDNKITKHNYQLSVDDLKKDRSRRLNSEIQLTIRRDNYNVIKTYKVKPIQIL